VEVTLKMMSVKTTWRARLPLPPSSNEKHLSLGINGGQVVNISIDLYPAVNKAAPSPLHVPQWHQKKSSGAKGLNKIQSLITFENIQISIKNHLYTKTLEVALNEETTMPSTEISEMLKYSDKDFKAKMTKIF
jgi:hypothetical protein